ncbi:MAG: hypothetical protein R3A78_06270 [Polyangiales bacterium]
MAATVQNNFPCSSQLRKIDRIIEIPNLIDIQKKSYEKFPPGQRSAARAPGRGAQGVFRSVF